MRHILIILFFLLLFSFTFISCSKSSTSSSTDTTPPTVSSSSPSDGDTSVSITSTVSVTFSETMDTSSISTNTLDTSCFGTFQVSSDGFTSCVQMSSSPTSSNSDKTFTVTPKDSFSYSTIYRIRITTVTKDSSGDSMTSQWTTSSGFQTTDNTTTDDSANITKALLTGTWTAKCSDNLTASTSALTELVFSASGDNLTETTTNYSDLSCVTQSSVFTKKLNTLILDSNKTTTSQNQIVYRYTAAVTDITLEPKTSYVTTSLNSFCGLTSWSTGTETSVAGLTCGSITYNAVNDSYFDIIWMNSEKTFIRLGDITNVASTGYPKTLNTQEYYK